MKQLHLVLLLVLGGCFLLSQPLRADDATPPFPVNKQFSAEQVVTAGNTSVTSKVYGDDGKMRSETTMNGMEMVSITRPDLQKIYSVMVAQKMVMEMPYDPGKVSQQASTIPEGKFELVGPDTVDGVACTKYKITSEHNKVSFMWIDAAKKVPVKMAAEDNSYSVLWKNYKIGPQDASLFEIPAGYQTIKIPAATAAAAQTLAPPESAPSDNTDNKNPADSKNP